ncbi:UDP-glucuronate 4-epimerase 2 [Vitis vinifera]|uniref:UDP-glucuronate 4-epimerase 2 n=1 Tax=Vitis vinifera TaxID=29760 RepID=A0A438DIE7_VITVI|nr:UDP-glucuronate 4-epimerase 2 [Vitis vinifera]
MTRISSANRFRFQFSVSKSAFWWCLFFIVLLCFVSNHLLLSDNDRRLLRNSGKGWEQRVLSSASPRSSSGSTVLVTGAAGFIGSHVSAALRNRGDGVVGLDNFNNYYDVSLKHDRRAMLESSGVFIVDGDINDQELLKKLFSIVQFTHVMHLAAQAGVRYAMKNPASYIDSNLSGFVNLLEVCKEAKPQPAIIWASSSSVYGLNSKVPFSETDRTDQPASLYAATKKAGEEIAHSYNHIYGLSITGLRFFTGGKGGVVARDFTYIDDIVKGCLAALDTAEKSTGSGGKKMRPAQLRVYNLGNTSPVEVGSLVNILERLLKVKARRVATPMPRNGDVMYTHADISLAEKELGYKPTTDLRSGLEKFVKWYLSYYNQSTVN